MTDWQTFSTAQPSMQQRIQVGIKQRNGSRYLFKLPFVWHPGGYCYSEETDRHGESLIVIRPPLITHWRAWQEETK